MTLYVDNLPFLTTEQDLREHFGRCGTVHSVLLSTDGETGQRRGFAFVEMEAVAGRRALQELDGASFHGRVLRVLEALQRPTSR